MQLKCSKKLVGFLKDTQISEFSEQQELIINVTHLSFLMRS